METAEATQLGIVATEDRDALLGAGIDPEDVDSLPSRAGAFTFAAARYQSMTATDPEATKRWKEISPQGYDVQRYLIRNLGFAYRKDKDLTKAVSIIARTRVDSFEKNIGLTPRSPRNPHSPHPG